MLLDIVRPNEFYENKTDFLNGYYKQAATFLNIMKGMPYEEALTKVKALPIKDPKVVYNVRDMNTKDRTTEETTLRNYLRMVRQENLVIAPSLTAYIPASENKSFLGRFIIKKMKSRSVFKHMMMEKKMQGDTLGVQTYNSLQSVSKELNNSASGAQSIASNPIYNKSAHPTLTGGCRTATSYANISNEYFLSGNRPYFTHHDVINHSLSVLTMVNKQDVVDAVQKLSLHIPTPDELYGVIIKSLSKYAPPSKSLDIVKTFINKLDNIQRCMICYTYDLYHLAKFNDSVTRQFLTQMSEHGKTDNPESVGYFNKLSGDLKTMVLFQHSFTFNNRQFKDDLSKDASAMSILDNAAYDIVSALTWFEPIIKAFWLNGSQHINHAYMDMVRREVVSLSDTDSTVFTNQEWTKYITGSYNFDPLSFKVGNTTTYLAAKLVSHHLRAMSVNFNISREEITRIDMKNEFYFTILALTDVAKHYAAMKWGQEGNVLPELELELKGVNLRNSNWPIEVRDKFTEYADTILKTVSSGKELSRNEIIGSLLDLENKMIKDINSGTGDLYNTTPVREPEAYKAKADASPYKSYLMWNEIFGPKYGNAPEPPYNGIKVPVNIPNPTALRGFIESIKDKALADRFDAYVKRHNKKDLTIITLPEPVIASTGVPEEIIPYINKDTLLSNVTGGYYLFLGSFGLYPRDKNYSVSLIDIYNPARL